jgi:hypothetical protein
MLQRRLITVAASLLFTAFIPAPEARADDAGAPGKKERRASVPVDDQRAAVDRVHAERARRRDAEGRLEQWRQGPPADAAPATHRAMKASRTRASGDRRSTP